VNTTKTDELIEILFGVCTRVSPKDYPLGGDLDPLGEGSIFGGHVLTPGASSHCYA